MTANTQIISPNRPYITSWYQLCQATIATIAGIRNSSLLVKQVARVAVAMCSVHADAHQDSTSGNIGMQEHAMLNQGASNGNFAHVPATS